MFADSKKFGVEQSELILFIQHFDVLVAIVKFGRGVEKFQQIFYTADTIIYLLGYLY